jgi:hypothetical protein
MVSWIDPYPGTPHRTALFLAGSGNAYAGTS